MAQSKQPPLCEELTAKTTVEDEYLSISEIAERWAKELASNAADVNIFNVTPEHIAQNIIRRLYQGDFSFYKPESLNIFLEFDTHF